ncbi:DUF2267 domain-containing protein [Kitasatospora sp. GAS204B]|uniref:DUF2267 domain-containing protein n=1 Tax=unclassified Kitasatospora TaxID=2633591 RepID=UPI002475EA06|nr:DUF2267 domain-containing protein [Kitasatospora sp. GAS204B]MDH6119696.1 uncharacterized protein (DUF2267 family) [Kitasatospora sp. GAS204B]
MTWHILLQQVRDLGRYHTNQEAERVVHAVLATLGGQLIGEERCDLAAALPEPARTTFASQIPLTQPLDPHAFVDTVASTLDATTDAARWHTGAVLAALTNLADEPLTGRVLTQLPHGYALLYGRADLTAAA